MAERLPWTARRAGFPAALLASALFVLPPATTAQAKSLRAELKPYCMQDYLRLCDPSATSRSAVVACFKHNVSSVSARCKRAIDRKTEFNPSRIERRRN